MSWPFCIGNNLQHGANWGAGVLWGGSDIDDDLKAMKSMGMTILRIFAGDSPHSDQEIATALDSFLTTAAQYGISVLICPVDYYQSPFTPASLTGVYAANGYLKDSFWTTDWHGCGASVRLAPGVSAVLASWPRVPTNR